MLRPVRSSAAAVPRDPGPLARLEDVKRDPGTLGVIAQRVAGGETLKSIAKAWEVPYGQLQIWLMDDEERWALFRKAQVLGGFAESDEAKELLDTSTPETIAVDKERANIRKWRASKNANEFFGERLEVTHHTSSKSEEALMAQLQALISTHPTLLDDLLAMRAKLALPAAGATHTITATEESPAA
jgi:hypothetical protein